MKTRIILFMIGACLVQSTMAQNLNQTVRGTLLDQDTQTPLIGATVVIMGTDPIVGAVTDFDGNFRISDVPVGRISLKISYVGYEDRVMPNLLVTSAKEVVLDASLVESFERMEEVVISAKSNKAEVLNEMSLVSVRSFTVEETKRYAGSFADPARMVSAYAGVSSAPEGNNDIIVRGNSPRGVLWRLNGLEIPNPNHFASEGATGGPINALNSNMLSDSDFMSGAFAPEYGNALSGVFDMKLKKGNNEQREYTAGISTLGLDFTMEGPFKPGYNGSYIANYRYSTLTLIDAVGIADFGGVPKYQDATFNVHLPIGKKHFISLFGLGGLSKISGDDTVEGSDEVVSKSSFGADMGTMALTYNYLISDRSHIKATLSASGTRMTYDDNLPTGDGDFYNAYNAEFKKSFMRSALTFNHKFNSRHKIETGIIYSRLGYDMIDNVWNFDLDEMENLVNDAGHSYSTQAFSTWQYRIAEPLTLVSGVHLMHFDLNNSYSIEPRAALQWKVANDQSLSLGVGVHSRLEAMSTYLGKQVVDDGSFTQLNRDLGLSKAIHYVLGYDRMFGPNLHLKAEIYYQDLYDVPIEDAPGSTFSMLNNSDGTVYTPLTNQGTGRNYGIELTLERYLDQGMYFMTSGSLYKSLYTAMDGIERNTAFDGGYNFNALGGKEWKIGKPEKNKVLFVNAKVTLIGGKPYTPINLDASREQGEEVRYEDRPFSAKGDDVFIFNFSIGTRRNKRNTTREFKIDIQNMTNHQAVVNQYYVSGAEDIVTSYQLQFFPTISYTISF